MKFSFTKVESDVMCSFPNEDVYQTSEMRVATSVMENDGGREEQASVVCMTVVRESM